MQFSFEFTASAEDIFEKITDSEFILDRCLSMGSIDAQCDSNQLDLPKLTITRTETAELPSMMKKIIGEQQTVTTVEQWTETDQSYESESLSKIAGTPIKITTRQSIYNTEQGSEIDIDLTVSAKIPLIGKKVEPMVASKIRQEMLLEFKYLEKALS